tara:strand:+ start:1144 stop:2655 length:1512 start_codon:yes stop_codon:yes gene_type:complete
VLLKHLSITAFCSFLLVGSVACSSSNEEQVQQFVEQETKVRTESAEKESISEETSTQTTENQTGSTIEEKELDSEESGPSYKSGDSDYIFDQEQLHTFELTLSDQNLSYLDSAPALEEYVPGTLTFEGETLPVGIRYKGSVGAWVGCLSGDLFQTDGEKTCTKLSMKVKINWEDSDDTFYEVKKLQFHSQNLDPTKMHERLGYYLFREMGVPAPRSVHARLIINGEYNGVYALTEQIDGRFTRENFNDGTGNLYKEVWPITNKGEPRLRDGDFEWALKTNEDEDPTFDIVHGFSEAIAKSDESNRQEVMREWMDIDQVLAYAVVDRAIANDDGVFHWYCDNERIDIGDSNLEQIECNPHNFYWYEDPTARTMHLIPWDLDNAFQNISQPNPVTPIKDKWGEITNDCKAFTFGGWGLPQLSAACDPIIATWASFEPEYEEIRNNFFTNTFTKEDIENLINTWAGQIKDSVQEAAESHKDQPSLRSWLSNLERFKNDLQTVRNNN